MIEKMRRLTVYSFREQTSQIMEEIMKCGVVQIERAESMLPEDTAKLLKPAEVPDVSEAEKALARIRHAISVLAEFSDAKGMFAKRHSVSYSELADAQVINEGMEICEKVERISEEIRDGEKELAELRFHMEAYEPWEEFDLVPDEMMTETCIVQLYIVPAETEIEAIYEMMGAFSEESEMTEEFPIYIEQVSSDKEHRYVAVLCHNHDRKQIGQMLAALGARSFEPAPRHRQATRKAVAAAQQKIADAHTRLQTLAGTTPARHGGSRIATPDTATLAAPALTALHLAHDALSTRIRQLETRQETLQTESVDIITGWIPQNETVILKDRLERYTCFCEFRRPKQNEDYPVLISNSRLVRPFGSITEMYSLPSPHSIDTNWAVGIFFWLFFGMMLSDAGYGLILLAGGFLGAKYLDVSDGAKQFMKMIALSGISAIVWGAVYGSWFGDAIPKISETFFGRTIEMPVLIDPLTQPMSILILSCALGIVHLFIGMGIRAYIMIKRGNRLGALFDVGLWYVFLTGLLLLLAPGVFGSIGKVLAIAGALGLVLTQGRHKPTIAGKLTAGVMSLYDVTGYFSDVLSYSRILALGLATGVVASVVNIMATMGGNGVLGMILFVAVFAAGHILNLAINALGAYVHSARLQYVEFFGKYYEGGGRKFDPLRIRTKYVRVLEDR